MSSDREAHVAKVKEQIAAIQNKHAAKKVFGYYGNAAPPERAEGEVWEDAHGKKWTKKDGSISSVDRFEGYRVPWFCPECKKLMPHDLDTKFWQLRGKCMDCVITEETKMRANGTWEAYEKDMMRRNYMAYLRDAITELTDLMENLKNPEIIHADDENILMIEKWDIDLDTIKADMQKEIDILVDVLARVERGEE